MSRGSVPIAVVWVYDKGEWWFERADVGDTAVAYAESHAAVLRTRGEVAEITAGTVPEPVLGAAHPLATHKPTKKPPK